MARRNINFDRTEVVIGFNDGKRFSVLNLQYSDIQRIQFDSFSEMKLFRKVPSEKISITTAKRAEPIVYTRGKNAQFWDEYKAGFRKFAENNSITFADNT